MKILTIFNKKNYATLRTVCTFAIESDKIQSFIINITMMDKQIIYKLQHEAASFLKEKSLILKDVTIIPREIEIYYYEKGVFEDGSVHQNELQQNNKEHFYIHRWGNKKTDSYKGGNYPGIDFVVSGEKDVYYTYLIRSAIINGEPVLGPHKVLMGIKTACQFNGFNDIENNPVLIQSCSNQGEVLFSERINLGKNAGEYASIEFRAVICDKDFRDSKYLRKECLVTNHILSSTMSKEDALDFSKKYLGYIPIKVKNFYA